MASDPVRPAPPTRPADAPTPETRAEREVETFENMMWADVDGEIAGAKRSLDHMVQNMGTLASVRTLVGLAVLMMVGVFAMFTKSGWIVGAPILVTVFAAVIVPRMCIDVLVRHRDRVLGWCLILQVLGAIALIAVSPVISQTNMHLAMATAGVGMAMVIFPLGVRAWVFADSRVISKRHMRAQMRRIARAAGQELREAGASGAGQRPPIAPAVPKVRKKPMEDPDDNVYRNLR